MFSLLRTVLSAKTPGPEMNSKQFCHSFVFTVLKGILCVSVFMCTDVAFYESARL